MKKLLLLLVGLFVIASAAQAQTVSQGRGGDFPWSVKFDQIATNNVVDLEDNLARLVGRIVFDSAQPVTQSGVWTVQPGNTANTTAWLFKLSQTTSDNDVDVLTLPSITGTVTANAGSGTFIVGDGAGAINVICDSGCGGAAPFSDNTAFTFGTTGISNVGFVLDDVVPNAATENSAAAARISANRMQLFQLGDGAGNERRANVTATNALVVDGSAVTQPVSATNLDIRDLTSVTDSVTATLSQTGSANDVDVLTLPSVTVGVFPDNEPFNLNQIAGGIVSTVATGVQEVGISDATGVSFLSAANALNSTGAGIQTAQGVGQFDDVTPTAITENQFGNLRMSANRNLFGTIRDAAGNERGVNVTATNALVVDGSAVTQPVSGTVTVGTFPDNEPFNVAQFGGSIVVTGTGAGGAGIPRVTVSNDSTVAISQTTTNNDVDVLTLPNEGQQTAANSISVTPDTDNDAVAANAAAPPTGRVAIGGLTSGATAGLMLGVTVCDTWVNVDVVTATTTLLVTGVSARHVRFCSMTLFTAGINNVALISGTGATCGTGTTGMTGGTTAAEGFNFVANQGVREGTGFGEINRTNATGDSVCVITSAAVQLSGRIGYAIY
jgi:hypothetical protein